MDNRLIQLEYNDKKITLIPTAHVSKDSAAFVAETIDSLQPDCICVELDKDRYQSIQNPDRYKETSLVQVIKDGRVAFMLVNIILSNYQKRLARQLDSTSGQEMIIGINKSKEMNCELVLADRSIQTTFKRVWRSLDIKDKFKLISVIISSLFDDEEITEEDLAALQQSDALNSALQEVSKTFPKLSKVLVEERDRYLAYKIKNAPGTNIVAILGAAHTIGIQKYINEDYSIAELDQIPEKTIGSKLSGWIIPAVIIIAIIMSFSFNKDNGWQQIRTWILCNGTISAIGTIIAGGHIISALVAFIAAPITSLNPLMAAGWFAGLTEAAIRKPTVDDFSKLSDDLTFAKLRQNRVTKVLMVVIFANLGSTIGTFLSGLGIFNSLLGH